MTTIYTAFLWSDASKYIPLQINPAEQNTLGFYNCKMSGWFCEHHKMKAADVDSGAAVVHVTNEHSWTGDAVIINSQWWWWLIGLLFRCMITCMLVAGRLTSCATKKVVDQIVPCVVTFFALNSHRFSIPWFERGLRKKHFSTASAPTEGKEVFVLAL